jgi:hypothetical protein
MTGSAAGRWAIQVNLISIFVVTRLTPASPIASIIAAALIRRNCHVAIVALHRQCRLAAHECVEFRHFFQKECLTTKFWAL